MAGERPGVAVPDGLRPQGGEVGAGGGLTPRHEYIFDQEGGRYELPTGVFSIGLGMCGPTLLAHGTEDQKARYIRPMLQGEEIWSQIFSEPAAGSDLAALRTKAVRDGDAWSLTG
ncbi:MAG TPA: acyl-CoA dehydrogenase family protein, partial [Acidimicrobiia bacterium]|nr:acyl-CoA dehydrogenase family protein [Acidimicrobiia bacterium]